MSRPVWNVRCDVCGRGVPVERTRAAMWGACICRECDDGPFDDEPGLVDSGRSSEIDQTGVEGGE